MSRRIILLLSLFVLLQLQGCAYNAQQANLEPSAVVSASDEGRGISVAVRVVDERASKSLGRRADTFGPAAEITAVQDLVVLVDQQVKSALKAKGFNTVEKPANTDPILKVEIRLFEYSMSQGWTFGLHVKGALKVVATRATENYEQFYRTEAEERVFVVPTEEINESIINAGLSKLLNEMFNDASLFKFLAGQH